LAPGSSSDTATAHATLTSHQRVEQIEKAYEYLLAYAAQGLAGQAASGRDSEARARLESLTQAIDGLVASFRERCAVAPAAASYEPFLEVLARDARSAAAAAAVVLAQEILGSQLVDNFNASQHVRALLTDLFLLDEAVAEQPAP
jgi:hypothetical protein